MLPVDDRVIETCRSVFKCFNVNFRLLKTIYVHLLVCYLNFTKNVVRISSLAKDEFINLLAPKLFFLILAHLYIKYE